MSNRPQGARLDRRLNLMDDLLYLALRIPCQFFPCCPGPEAPIRDMKTCSRCACINRAIRMGLVKKVEEDYVRESDADGVSGGFVEAGVLEQFSVLDGSLLG